jgi:hypothetical protein
MSIWPIIWPDQDAADALAPAVRERAELLAGSTLHMLTLQRVGGMPVTVMPQNYRRQRGLYIWDIDITGAVVGTFYPGMTYPGQVESEVERREVDAVILEGPVGRVDSIRIDGIPFTGEYRVEDGNKLIRLDGKDWPTGTGDNFTVTYLKGYEVDSLGQYIGGVLAVEYLKQIQGAKGCRLPAGTTSASRQGLNITISPGMFPEGRTYVPEVDAYLYQWNPYGLKTAPKVYSPDKPKARTTTWRPGL